MSGPQDWVPCRNNASFKIFVAVILAEGLVGGMAGGLVNPSLSIIQTVDFTNRHTYNRTNSITSSADAGCKKDWRGLPSFGMTTTKILKDTFLRHGRQDLLLAWKQRKTDGVLVIILHAGALMLPWPSWVEYLSICQFLEIDLLFTCTFPSLAGSPISSCAVRWCIVSYLCSFMSHFVYFRWVPTLCLCLWKYTGRWKKVYVAGQSLMFHATEY